MYLREIAERIRRGLPPGTPTPPDSDELFLLYALLARSKGGATTAEDVHDAWAAWQVSRNPDHPALVPYEQLSPQARDEDEPFLVAIRRATGR